MLDVAEIMALYLTIELLLAVSLLSSLRPIHFRVFIC